MTQDRQSLLIRRPPEAWRSPQVQAYKDEEMLKLMLRDSPQLLPFYAEGSIYVDELTVPAIGSVDLCGVDGDGSITLVECKLENNAEIRRAIIGQIFAYAAGLWQLSYESFDRAVAARQRGTSLADAIAQALPERKRTEWEEETFRRNVADNLGAGRFTLVIAVDRITEELKRVVPYVNAHTVPDLRFLALEIDYIKDGDVEIVRPLTYGQESADEKPRLRHTTWSFDAYLERVTAYSQTAAEFIDALITFSRNRGAVVTGGTGAQPSINVRFSFDGTRRTVWSSYLQNNGPTFDLNFEYIRDLVPREALLKCAQIASTIPGVGTKYNGIEPLFKSRPSLPIDPILTQPGSVEVVERALGALLS